MNEEQSILLVQNSNNLMALARFLKLSVAEDEVLVIEHQEWRDRYKVSLGNLIWYVKTDLLPKFWLSLENKDYDAIAEFSEKNESIKFRHTLFPKQIDNQFDESDPFFELTDEDFHNVDRRTSGLITAGSACIREIAKLINEEMDAINKDTDVVKDFDGILTFNTPVGKNFNVGLCFDKVKPVDAGNEKVVIERTPITGEDLKTYLRDAGPKIISRLNTVNGLVKDLFNSKKVQSNAYLTQYAISSVEVTLTMAFLNQTITYISFGGVDDWRPQGEETPNNNVCMKILDDEIEHLIKVLEDIPLEKGVDLYSIDMDTFAIFGRNNDNKVVTPALQGYTQDILNRYSRGFERLLAIRMGLSDNAHFFKA